MFLDDRCQLRRTCTFNISLRYQHISLSLNDHDGVILNPVILVRTASNC